MESQYSVGWLQTSRKCQQRGSFKAARASLKRNQANIIVANDLGEITPNQHIAYLVDEKGEEMVTTKSAIAQALYERICYD